MAVLVVTIVEGKDLKNVNWKKNEPLSAYVKVSLGSKNNRFTHIDNEGDTSPCWNNTISLPVNSGHTPYLVLHFEVLHAGPESPLVGSAELKLHDKINGLHTLELIRPSGRKQGTIKVQVLLRESLPSQHLGHRQRNMPSSVKSNDRPSAAWRPILHHHTPPTTQPGNFKRQIILSPGHKPSAKMGGKVNTCAAAGRGGYQWLDDDKEEDDFSVFDSEEEDDFSVGDSDEEGLPPRKFFYSDQREMHPRSTAFSRSSPSNYHVSMLSEMIREKFEKVSLEKRDDEDVCWDSPRLFIYSTPREMEESCGSNLTPPSTALYQTSSLSRPATMQSSNMGGKGPRQRRKT